MKSLELTHQYHPQLNRESAYIVLHGASEGIDSDFIQYIHTELVKRGEAVLSFNWPYLQAGGEPSDNLLDEQSALQEAAEFMRSEGYTRLHIVAKSLGGIVASRWLQQPNDLNVEVGILGFVIGDVATDSLAKKLRVVVQGERDRFGNAEKVRKELAIHDINSTVIEIADADHSYRNTAGEPFYQQQAVQELLAHI